jgi:hypothetical protein
MVDRDTFEADINLLAIQGPLNDRNFLEFLCVTETPDQIVDRYKKITSDVQHHKLAILLAERNIRTKISLSMKAAVGCYVAANYLGTVAICGMICEMLAILEYELADNKPKPNEEKLFGSSFEKLRQGRRIDVLRGLNVIDDEQDTLFRVPMSIRNRYLHRFSQSHEPIAEEALQAWSATPDLVLRTLKLRPSNGKIVISSKLSRYLRKHGSMG